MDVKEGSQVHGNGRFRNLIFGVRSIAARAALAMAIVSALTGVLTQSAQAQTYTVIYNFTGAQDGAFPEAGVTLDRGGNLYGTTSGPGFGGDVYRLTNQGGDWVFSPLYHFTGGMGGASPYAKVVFGPDGTFVWHRDRGWRPNLRPVRRSLQFAASSGGCLWSPPLFVERNRAVRVPGRQRRAVARIWRPRVRSGRGPLRYDYLWREQLRLRHSL